MNNDIESLIDRWLEGSLDTDQQHQLTAWLKQHPEDMQRFVEANVRHQMLSSVVRGVMVEEEVSDATSTAQIQESNAQIQKRRSGSSARIAAGVSLAACLLVAAGWFFQAGDRVEIVDSFLSVAMIQGTQAGQLKVGDRLGAQTISIADGLVRLQFDDGVEVTLQGPAGYELISPGRTRLHSGLLTATVPPGAEGFQVDTPTAAVVDLGTAFGIELDAEGFALVSVFDGEVQVTASSNTGANNKDKTKRVREGEAVRVTSVAEVQSTKFDTVIYEKIWPVSSGIAGSTGAFRFAPPWPRPMGRIQSDTDIFVLPEGYPQTLAEPLAVNVSLPGQCRTAEDFTPRELPPGTRVKSFLLQFNPVDQRDGKSGPPGTAPDPNELKRIVGEITFDRPVLGLIVRGDDLRASDLRFSVRGGQVPQKGRALELSGTARDDIVTLGEDRRTVKLDLAAFGLFSDQVRVIVDQSLVK